MQEIVYSNSTQEKILELIRLDSYITQVEIAEKLGLTRDTISYNIKYLKDNGIIERIGSTKKGGWKITKKKFMPICVNFFFNLALLYQILNLKRTLLM